MMGSGTGSCTASPAVHGRPRVREKKLAAFPEVVHLPWCDTCANEMYHARSPAVDSSDFQADIFPTQRCWRAKLNGIHKIPKQESE
jgi:hypothetical protein